MVSNFRSVLFTGVRGSGKSTIIQQLKSTSNFSSIYFDSYSNLLKSLVEKDEKDFSLFDSMSPKIKHYYRQKVISRLQFLCIDQIVFIEGHLSMYNSQLEDYEILFNQSDLIFFDLIIYFDISAQTIFKHRANDSKKSRINNISIVKQEIAYEEIYLKKVKTFKPVINVSSLSEIETKLYEILSSELL
ncbi:MAG: ATP-binding protein [Promethearchaeota archaeon]